MRLRIVFVAAALCAVLAAAAQAEVRPVTPEDKQLLARGATYEEKIAEQVTARLTRHKVSVRCGQMPYLSEGMAGVTFVSHGHSFDYYVMRPEECTYLAWFRQDPARWDPRTCAPADCAYVSDVALALETVSHESYHILGYTNEARVECYGLQSLWFVATSLGASAAEGQRLAMFYWKTAYAQRRTSTPAYWTAECRNGGKYDLRPSSNSWPS